jgi:hypothetical protein
MRMKCSTELSLGPSACKENSDENEVLDRIVPGGYLSLGRTRMTAFSASWSFNHARRLAPNWLLSVFVKGDMTFEGRYSSRMVVFQKNVFRVP